MKNIQKYHPNRFTDNSCGVQPILKLWIIFLVISGCKPNSLPVQLTGLEQVKQLSEKAATYKQNDLDSAIYYNQVALTVAEEEQLSPAVQLQLLMNKSELFDLLGLTDSSENLIARAETLVAHTSDPREKALLNHYKGSHHFMRDEYSLAEQYLTEAGAYFLENQNDSSSGIVFFHLGLLYERLGLFPQAQDFFLKASASFFSLQDTLSQTASQIQLAKLYKKQQLEDQLKKSLESIMDSRGYQHGTDLPYKHLQELAIAAKDLFPDSAVVWQNKAAQEAMAAKDSSNYYLSKTYSAAWINEFPRREEQLLSAIAYFENKQEKSSFLIPANDLAAALILQKKYPEAEFWLDKALQYGSELQNDAENLPLLTTLQNLYQQSGKIALAIQIRDSIMSLKQELLKKNATTSIVFLTKAQNLQQINHQKELLSATLELQRKRIKFRNSIIFVLLAAGIILLFIAYKIYLTNQNKKNATQILLESYKRELQQLNNNPPSNNPDNSPEKDLEPAWEKLTQLMESQQLYLQTSLKVEDVLEIVEISYKELTQLLKEKNHSNFKNFLNTHRIEHAKKLLTDTSIHNLSIRGVGLESGFGSKQNFYNTFQQHLGVTPGEFKKALHKKNSEN